MFNIFICEDNTEELKNIENAVKEIINTEHIDLKISLSTTNPYEILNCISKSSTCGLYFLDVDLNTDINGIELAEEIRKHDPRGFIVFITTHAEMSYLTFLYKVEAMDYIIKDNYLNLNSRVHDCIINAYKKFSIKSSSILQNFAFKTGDKLINVKFDDIMFFETSETIHKVILHCMNRQIEFYSKMKDIEKQIDGRFYRCHRSFIVNKENIKKLDIENRIIYMNNEEQCLASSRLLKGLIKNIDTTLYT